MTDERKHDDVAQALPPVRTAKPALSSYRRNLPHLQRDHRATFVTFATRGRAELPPSARSIVLTHCLHDHGKKLYMHAAVVMPDHVHALFTAMRDDNGSSYGLAEIMRGMKGASARSVNRVLARSGPLWQDESYDHVLRRDEGLRDAAQYICRNPVEAGIAEGEDDYPWLWREWVEGIAK